MDTNQLTPEEVNLAARALSIHRASMRRKLDKLRPDSREHLLTLDEIRKTQDLMMKFHKDDVDRLDEAG